MPAPPIHYTRTNDGVDIAYWTLGEGPTLFILHPPVDSHIAVEWEVPRVRRFYEDLARDFRIVRANPRCCGLSGDSEDFSVATHAADIAAVAVAVAVEVAEAAILSIGSSTRIALAAARQPTLTVTSLALLSPLVRHPKTGVASWAIPMARGVPDTFRQTMAQLYDPEHLDPPGALRRLQDAAIAPEKMPSLAEQSLEWDDMDEALPSIQTPALVVQWEDAQMWRDGPHLAAGLPQARLTVRAGRCHPWYDPDPDSLIALIRDFFLEHAEPSSTPSPPSLRNSAPRRPRPPTSPPGSLKSFDLSPAASPTPRSPRNWSSRPAPWAATSPTSSTKPASATASSSPPTPKATASPSRGPLIPSGVEGP